ncbi:MAG TPA: hypothetical protein VHB20_09210 [Verrucomicrobiae bacterium]|jgi:hypothetical protein|nr:hypothetical protein [Verrucomicrobiae bacterium]
MKKELILWVAVIGLLTGCGTDYRVPSVICTKKPYATTWSKMAKSRVLTDIDARWTYINPYTYNPMAMTSAKKPTLKDGADSYYKLAMTSATEDDRQRYRNALQDAILDVVTEATAQHLAELKGTENAVNLFLGAATLGLSGGAAVVGGTAARALAASAAGTAGARSLVNEQVYRNTFVESVTALIQRDQADFKREILRRQTTNSTLYPVDAAIMDAKEYETRGGFYNGLSLLQVAVQNQVQGRTNAVPINQISQAVQVTSTLPATGTITHAAVATTPTTATVTVSGSGFSVLDLNNIQNSVETVKAISAFAASDSQLTITFQTALTAVPSPADVTDTVTFTYNQGGGSHTLKFPVKITVQ